MIDSSKTRPENIYRSEAGPNLKADECTTPKQVFDHFIDSRIQELIVGFTNRQILITRSHYNCKVNYVYYIDRDELLVFIGLCFWLVFIKLAVRMCPNSAMLLIVGKYSGLL